MAESFGIPQLVDYLTHMGLKITSVDREQEAIELAFHGEHGQWRMIIGFQQSGEIRKLMLLIPNVSIVGTKKRLECLEALMAVNYHIAIGKFGFNLDDGEVRLEECVPLANDRLSLPQFRLAFRALMQTVAIYYSLIPRIIYGDLDVREALRSCEQDFFQQEGHHPQTDISNGISSDDTQEESESLPELNVADVLAEATRILEEHKE
jgi:hypothetical protein